MTTHLNHNGIYLQRRKMYDGVPFHNMKSIVELEWLPDDPAQHRKEKRKLLIQSEKERLKQVYEQRVEQRLQQRYLNNLDYSRVRQEGSNSTRPLDDTLNKELEAFNTSKVHQPQLNPQNQGGSQQGQSGQTYNLRPDSHRKSTLDQPGGVSPYQSQDISNRRSSLPRQGYELESPTRRYETIGMQSGRPQLGDSRVPFPGKLGYREIEEMYTGYSPEQYPFRNVKPDNLQNFLREKTKADHKRAINVTLNLFKY